MSRTVKGAELFLDEVYRLSTQDEESAVDAAYDFVDDCLLDGDFTACAIVLASADPRKMLHSVILSFLIVTRRAEGHLAGGRAIFYGRAFAAVSATHGNDYAEELLGKQQ